MITRHSRAMKTSILSILRLLLGLLILPGCIQAASTSITYQGRLTDGGGQATGHYDMVFQLHSTPSAFVNPISLRLTNSAVAVTGGLFTVSLDFQPVGAGIVLFDGNERWREIAVQTNGNVTPFAVLNPRQPLTSAPYAVHATSASSLMSPPNAPLNVAIDGERVLRVELPPLPGAFNHGAPNVIGGSESNFVNAGVYGATISGGGVSYYQVGAKPNRVFGNWGTIGGGFDNLVGSEAATVGGGTGHGVGGNYSTVSGGKDNGTGGTCSTVGGGLANFSRGNFSTIAGGWDSLSDGAFATVGGGENHLCSGDHATIGGGYLNDSTAHATTVGGGSGNRATGRFATIP
jgi:hypothetical protein